MPVKPTRQPSASAPVENAPDVLYARTVADQLERHLEKASTSIHWAQAAGGETTYGPPKLVWPRSPSLAYSFDEGSNEGVIMTVSDLQSGLNSWTPLLKLKFLGAMRSVMAEAVHVAEYLTAMDTPALLALQVQWERTRAAN